MTWLTACCILAGALSSVAEQVAVDASGGIAEQPDTGAAKWTVDEVAEWLDQSGFSAQKKNFVKAEIDGIALKEITEEELKEMSITLVGQRKRFGRLLCDALPDCKMPVRKDEMSEWSAEQVANWLDETGFGDHKKAFIKNEVDGQALPEITEEELKDELGVAKLGARRRFGRKLCDALPDCSMPARTDEMEAWSVEQVVGWLEESGFGDYKKAFTSHEIDGAALPEITEEELKTEKLITKIGPRKHFRQTLCAYDRNFCIQQEQDQMGQHGLGDLGGLGSLGAGMDWTASLQAAQKMLQGLSLDKGGDGEGEGGLKTNQLLKQLLGGDGEDGEAIKKAYQQYMEMFTSQLKKGEGEGEGGGNTGMENLIEMLKNQQAAAAGGGGAAGAADDQEIV